MIYTSGIKTSLEKDDDMPDNGCGWGILARYASTQHGAHVTEVTLDRNLTAWGNFILLADGVPSEKSSILCMDYRVVPKSTCLKIICIELGEHAGIRSFPSFLGNIYDPLDDDGVRILQLSRPRKARQCEDLVWGPLYEQYGSHWFRYFLVSSTIMARQRSATCYQIILVRNLNST
ncbi:putative fatty acid methyltransferase [Calycina marina]|uniref:sphingolipid C(9)-methyltransferase n=1 Tax=Calycina marina TaxID=1763456 RepID=A0A9P7YXZ9_9HELO|nr:putative fatty acid methyltransferase [Calycina marina]